MAKQQQTPLQIKYEALPKSLVFKTDILPILEASDISGDTFYRDLKAQSNSIPVWRLQVYAGLLGLDDDISQLIDSFVKVKPIIKRKSLAKSLGLKK